MKIILDIRKTLEENAGAYFDASKKAKKKLKGLEKALVELKKKEAKAEKIAGEEAAKKKAVAAKKSRKASWFEKFRWFITSDGFLCIGGRDAATNEIVIKKHTDKADIVLHTDMAGSPFVVIKSEGKDIPKASISEAAAYTAAMSRAWRNGLGTLSVFHVKPEQVSKEANAGESLPRGAFMIRGETTYHSPNVACSVCTITYEGEERVMVGPRSACEKNAADKECIVDMIPGEDKASNVAKQLKKELASDEDIDVIIRLLPSGGITVQKEKRRKK